LPHREFPSGLLQAESGQQRVHLGGEARRGALQLLHLSAQASGESNAVTSQGIAHV